MTCFLALAVSNINSPGFKIYSYATSGLTAISHPTDQVARTRHLVWFPFFFVSSSLYAINYKLPFYCPFKLGRRALIVGPHIYPNVNCSKANLQEHIEHVAAPSRWTWTNLIAWRPLIKGLSERELEPEKGGAERGTWHATAIQLNHLCELNFNCTKLAKDGQH